MFRSWEGMQVFSQINGKKIIYKVNVFLLRSAAYAVTRLSEG